MNYKKIAYIAVTVVMTFLFIYILFPYKLVTEVVVGKIQTYLNQMNTGLKIQADSISGYWLTGVQAKNLQISNQEQPNKTLTIDNLTARMSVLPLFIGRINVNTNIEIDDGFGEIFVSLSLIDLISQKLNIKSIQAEFDDFKLDNIFSQLLYVLKNNDDPNFSLIVPIISDSSIGGFLNGDLNYKSKAHYASNLNLQIKKAFLDINNETLGIPKQNFKTANIDVTLKDSIVTISKNTAFSTQNISFSANGMIDKTKKQNLNIKLNISLSGPIEKNFGFLLPQLLKCPSSSMIGGIMNVQLTGTADKLSCIQ